MRRAVGVVGLSAGVVAVGAAMAFGSGGSPAVTALPVGGQITGYQLAADRRGAATIVWSTYKFVDSGVSSVASLIRVSEQNPEGRWGAPVQLGRLGQSLTPVLAESQAGAAAIVWSSVVGSSDPRTLLEAVARRSSDAAWSKPQTIWATRGGGYALATVGIDSAGVATIAWTAYGGNDPAIWTAGLDTKTGLATRPEKLIANGAGGTDVTLAVNRTGAALLSWQRRFGPSIEHKDRLPSVRTAEMVSYRPASSNWRAPHRLSTFLYQEEPVGMNIWVPAPPTSAVTDNGAAATVWRAGSDGIGPLEISTRSAATGNWSTTPLGGTDTANDAVVTGLHDSLLTLWSSGSQPTFLTSISTNGMPWSVARKLSSLGNTFEPFLTGDANGNQTIAFVGPHSRILFTTHTTSNSWSTPRLVARGWAPEAVIASSGVITVAWASGLSPHEAIKIRTYH